MDPIDEGANKVKPLQGEGKKAQREEEKRKESKRVAYPDDRLADPIHEPSEEHSYTYFAKAGCRAPRRYSPDNRPSVHTWLDLEMVDHLGTRGSLHLTIFNRIMMEAKYFSAPTRSSTRGPSGCSLRHLRAARKSLSYCTFPSPMLRRFSVMELATSIVVDAQVVDGAADSLFAPLSDFIFPRLNISTR
ncbi:hypothetical protein B296_00041686 [Ensete ventricosum]|uniref:Uncharacterized protein n=1 Tax=Ensete ventricosum TaxID=4639 RepID=A0A426YZX6_ENSVE|nr:hypothetical protein B296_00041686 [Ensete ventricosum]